jgi:hypothetical protein
VVFEDGSVILRLLKDTWVQPKSIISVAGRVDDQLLGVEEVVANLPEPQTPSKHITRKQLLPSGFVLLKVVNAPTVKALKAVRENTSYLQYAPVPPLSKQIDDKYAELITLRDAKPFRKEAYENGLAELRALQLQEAEAIEKRFSARQRLSFEEADDLIDRVSRRLDDNP